MKCIRVSQILKLILPLRGGSVSVDGNSCVCGRRTQARRGRVLGVGRRRVIHWVVRVKSFGTAADAT